MARGDRKAARQEKKEAKAEAKAEKKAAKAEAKAEKKEAKAERKEEKRENRQERREERQENRAEFFDSARGAIGNVIDSARGMGVGALVGGAIGGLLLPGVGFAAGAAIGGAIGNRIRNKNEDALEKEIAKVQATTADMTANIVRETEEEVTDVIIEAADDYVEIQNDNLIKGLQEASTQVQRELVEISPSAADLFEEDFEAAINAIDNISDVLDGLINDPESVTKKEFVDLIKENTEILSATSEYVLTMIRQQIPEDSLLQDIFDSIDATNTELGITKTKLVFMMGANPAMEESTRDNFIESMESEVDALIKRVDLLKSKTPMDEATINELEEEINRKTDIVDALQRPVALDLYVDLFDGVSREIEEQIKISLDGSETDFVESLTYNVITEIPKHRKLTFTLVEPEPNYTEQDDQLIRSKVNKRAMFSPIVKQLVPTTPIEVKPIDQKQQKLNEDAIIKRILSKTKLDEQLEKEYKKLNDPNAVQKPATPTRDQLRVTKLEDELSDEAIDTRILNRLLKNTPTYMELVEQAEKQMAKDQTEEKPINLNLHRNSRGFITSDELVEEGMLSVELIDKKMMRRDTFENVVDVDFTEIELPFVTENMIEKLEEKIKQLEDDIIDLENETNNLADDKTLQRKEIDSKEDTIASLQQQIDDLNERFTVTPSEGTIFSIPWVYPNANKEDLDYWIIQNGERRRIKNYAMAQLMLDQRKKTILDIQTFDATVIRKIKQGTDVTIPEAAGTFWKVQKAVELNLYVPDQALVGGKIKVFWGASQQDINEHIRIGRVMDWMYEIGSSGKWVAGMPKTDPQLAQNYRRDFRLFLAKEALYYATKQVNVEQSIADNAAAIAAAAAAEEAQSQAEEDNRTGAEKLEDAKADAKADRKENRADRKADRKENRADRKADREDRKENRQDRRDARKELEGKERRDQAKEDRKENRAERQEDRKENKADRQADRAENKAERKADKAENKAAKQEARAEKKADKQAARAEKKADKQAAKAEKKANKKKK